MNNKIDTKSRMSTFASKIGNVVGTVIVGCLAVCLMAICIALTCRFIIWLL